MRAAATVSSATFVAAAAAVAAGFNSAPTPFQVGFMAISAVVSAALVWRAEKTALPPGEGEKPEPPKDTGDGVNMFYRWSLS